MTTGLINNGGGNAVGSSGPTNHKFSITPVGPNALTKTISISGQPGATGNKFYIHSTSLMNAAQQQQQQQQITLTSTGGGQPGTKALQYLAPANINFKLMTPAGSAGAGGAAGQAQDIKSILASSLSSNIIINDHPGNNIVTGGGASSGQQQAQHQTVSVQQQGQRPKTMNVFVDGEKRYLYTNNRGQFVAQLNPAKMMNIVPVTAAGGVSASQLSSSSSMGGSGSLNSNTKIITTKGVQLDNSNRIISSATAVGGGSPGMPTTRGFQTVQRLRAIRNSGQQQQQQQQHISHLTGGVGNSGSASTGEVRTYNRILIQSAPGAGTGTSVTIGGGGGGDPNGGASSTSAGDGRGGGNGASSTTAGGGNSATVSSINVNR